MFLWMNSASIDRLTFRNTETVTRDGAYLPSSSKILSRTMLLRFERRFDAANTYSILDMEGLSDRHLFHIRSRLTHWWYQGMLITQLCKSVFNYIWKIICEAPCRREAAKENSALILAKEHRLASRSC